MDEVLSILAENQLYVRTEKCQWMKKSLDYLGFTIQASTSTERGGKPSQSKIMAVIDWTIPTSVKLVQSFLGFTIFYRRFIKDYAAIATPLYRLTEKGTKFE